MSIELDEYIAMVELVRLCQEISDLYYAEKFDELNQMLVDVTCNPSNITGMCAQLRYASAAKEKLKDWKKIVNTAKDQLIIRDYDPNRILRGLDES